MDCAPENTREPRTGASARAFRVAVLDESYASVESFTLRGKVFVASCGKKLYGTVPCTRPPSLFSFLGETPHPCHSDARSVLIPGRNSPPLSFGRRKAEESAALHIVAESILRCPQLKRQASPPARRARRPPPTCMQVRALRDPRTFPSHPLSGIVSTRSSYLWRH
jgi:hypothetical protein